MVSNVQIIREAIQKAIAGGWKHRNGWTYLPNYKKAAPFNSAQFADENGEIWHVPIETIIFDHDFAEALWSKWPMYVHRGFERFERGEQLSKCHGEAHKDKKFMTGALSYENCQYHLQQMILANDRVKYLGKNI